MSARYRPVDLAVGLVLVLVLVGVASTMLAMVGPADQQAVCAANLRLFGQASADYVATWGVFAPCDPWPLMPDEPPGHPELRRNPNSWSQRVDPAHGWLLHQMGYVPFIGDPVVEPWWQVPYGFPDTAGYADRAIGGAFESLATPFISRTGVAIVCEGPRDTWPTRPGDGQPIRVRPVVLGDGPPSS